MNITNSLEQKYAGTILRSLGTYGSLRFGELQRFIAKSSPRQLSIKLKDLERLGLLTRKVFAQVPPRVEYKLTPKGNKVLDIYVKYVNDIANIK